MARTPINYGTTAGDGTGDVLFTSFKNINDNFIDLYNTLNLSEVSRRTLTPYKLVTYLPRESPYTTSTIPITTPTKVLIPTTVKSVNSFALVDIGGGNMVYRFNGTQSAIFDVSFETGIKTSTNNTVVDLEMFKNGVYEQGVGCTRKGSSTDIGNIFITGEVTLAPNDYIAIYVTVDTSTTITFSRSSINICERN